MTLRRAVIAMLCLAVVNVFAVDAHLHAAHGVGHAHNLLDAGPGTVPAAADHHGHEHAAHHEHASHLDHAGEDGPTVPHTLCDHAHCCVAFGLPTSMSESLPLGSPCRSRAPDQRLAGLRSPSFDRPPIAIL